MKICALCGHTFNETKLTCHTQCPLGQNCAVICCPNCGYQTVDESKSMTAAIINKVRQRLDGRFTTTEQKS